MFYYDSAIEKKSFEDKLEASKSPDTPNEELILLARDESAEIRRNVAKNPKTPIKGLTILVNDIYPDIRSLAGRNTSADYTIKSIINHDPNVFVRLGM